MRALLRVRTGDQVSLTYTSSYDFATTKDDVARYMVRVNSTSITRGELLWREALEQVTPIPGYDLAGTIRSGPSVASPSGKPNRFKPMDKVYGLTSFSRLGNARSVAVAEENELALMPSNITWEEAATVPLSALTAWQALFVHGGLTPPSITAPEGERIDTGNEGKRVLVTAASGGVGIWAVQLARQAGATVVGSCGPSNLEFVKSLGAGTAIDYTTISLPDWVGTDKETKGFDVVVDCVGGGTLSNGWHCARKGGRVISVAEDPAGFRPERGVAEGVAGRFFIVEANGEQLHEVTKLIEQERCKAVVDSVFDLEEWEKAFEKADAGHAKGKVVLKIDRGRLDDTDDNMD